MVRSFKQPVLADVFVGQQELGQFSTMDAQLVDRRHDLRLTLDDHIAHLIDTAGIENQAMLDCVKRLDPDGDGQRVADVHRLEELEALAEINRTRAGEPRDNWMSRLVKLRTRLAPSPTRIPAKG